MDGPLLQRVEEKEIENLVLLLLLIVCIAQLFEMER